MHDETNNKLMLRLFMVITDWENVSALKKFMKEFPMRFSYLTKAEGTATSETLDMFGLGKTDKALALCVVPQPIAESMLEEISDALRLKKRGTGIACTIPISGIAANIVKLLSDDARERVINHMEKMEMEAENMKNETSLTLIVSIINQGYSEDLMDAAKTAGATGGTVIHARRVGDHDHINFLGLPIQEEQEIVFIIARHEDKKDIMKAINHEFGLKSEGHGVTISLPVDDAVGLEMLTHKRD